MRSLQITERHQRPSIMKQFKTKTELKKETPLMDFQGNKTSLKFQQASLRKRRRKVTSAKYSLLILLEDYNDVLKETDRALEECTIAEKELYKNDRGA